MGRPVANLLGGDQDGGDGDERDFAQEIVVGTAQERHLFGHVQAGP